MKRTLKKVFVILSVVEGSPFVLSGDPSTALRMTMNIMLYTQDDDEGLVGA